VGEGKLKHYTCSSGAEFVISPDAEKVAAESSGWLREYMANSATASNELTILTITATQFKGMLTFQYKPRAEVLRAILTSLITLWDGWPAIPFAFPL
jgi:hypothetical protein